MRQRTAKTLWDSGTLVSAAELAEVIDVDIETINNWVRRDIVSRAKIGGRQLRNRLFSMEEVYKAALKNELVKLGIPPSSSSDAANALWRELDIKKIQEVRNIYGVALPVTDKWMVTLAWQKPSGGPLFKFGKSIGTRSTEELALPKQAFAMLPISEIFDRVSDKLSDLVG